MQELGFDLESCVLTNMGIWSETLYIYPVPTFEPQREETYLLTCAPNEYSNQPEHPHSLIRIFVVRMSLAVQNAPAEDSDQTARIFAGRTCPFPDVAVHFIYATLRTVIWENVHSFMCAQRTLRSVCASAQTDQNLRWALFGQHMIKGNRWRFYSHHENIPI